MKKIRIIINPNSGLGNQKKAERAINNLLEKSLFDYEIMYSQRKGHITLLAKEAAENNYDAVVVAGGDGSLNEAIQKLIGTKTALGIIPIGSGNALARHLHIPMSLSRSVKLINQFKIRQIDTANVNGHSFVSLAGIGFDAQVAKQFSFAKKRGLWNYVKISVREYFRFTTQKYRLRLDGKLIDSEAFMIVFANANQFGNEFIISPQGKIDDGLLDICIVQKPKLYQIPNLFIKLFLKKIHQSKLVNIHRAKQIQLEQNHQVMMNIDGEAVLQNEPINISINPLSLSVIS